MWDQCLLLNIGTKYVRLRGAGGTEEGREAAVACSSIK